MIIPVVLCGGIGARLWPLSRPSFPKQFLNIADGENGSSLFQKTINRLRYIGGRKVDSTIVVTNEHHRFVALNQLSELDDIKGSILLEPSPKNTAPALTFAAMYALDQLPNCDPILVVSPADHMIADQTAFARAITEAVTVAQDNKIVVLGIKAASPNTGYGYIKVRENANESGPINILVQSFVEKPTLDVAKSFLVDGGYYWNSGIFVMRSSIWLSALRRFRVDIYDLTKAAYDKRREDRLNDVPLVRPDEDGFQKIPSESIDYAVMEHCGEKNFPIQMIELDVGWNDLGSWDAVSQSCNKDSAENSFYGDVVSDGCKNTYIYSEHRLVAAVGIENIVVIETSDAVLVANKKSSQNVKKIIHELSLKSRQEVTAHRKNFRPWGYYDILDQGEFFKVKRIHVNPGASLSLQSHEHRAEHWVVVRGIAKIVNGNIEMVLRENQSAYIPKGNIHRLTNVGSEVLEVIEVQSGNYLGEDDITRFEDTYGRH